MLVPIKKEKGRNSMKWTINIRQVKKELSQTNLCGISPKHIIGRKYCFGAKFGSHYQVLVGTITGIQISDEGGIDLEVSSKRFHGLRLLSLKWMEQYKNWAAYLDDLPMDRRFRGGTLKLL